MKKTFVRILAIILALLMVLGIVTILVHAAYEPGGAYMHGEFYEKLEKVVLTGDARHDVIAVALSQVGYHEGDSEQDFDGMNLEGGKNFVEYNRLYGKVDNGEGNGVSYGYAWCASFVSWCQRMAGVPTSTAKSEISCIRMLNWYKSNSTYHARGDGYTPETGDVIFFKSGRNDTLTNHVGLVVGVKDSMIYTVEGNSGDVVCTHEFDPNDTYIVGYGVPNYVRKEGVSLEFPLEVSGQLVGKHYVTASSLNIRSGPGTSYPTLGALSKNTEVNVTGYYQDASGWATIDFKGGVGYVSTSYLMYAENVIYSVYYELCGGKGNFYPERKHAGETVTLSDAVPTQNERIFVGWATAEGSKNVEYMPGDTYADDKSITLWAIWERAYTVIFKDENGEFLSKAQYKQGEMPTPPEVPEKPSDGEFAYIFDGWGTEVTPVDGDKIYTVTYKKVPISELSDNATEPADAGCGSAAASIVAILSILGTAVIFKKI